MNPLELFEDTDKTVSSFNNLFPRSVLDYSPDLKVSIGRLVQGGLREVTVGNETMLHEIVTPKMPSNKVKKHTTKPRRVVTESVTYATYTGLEDMEMSASVYKLWQVIKAQDSEWHTERGLSEATRLNEKRVRLSLRELKRLGKIVLETSNKGLRVGIV